MTSNNVLKTAKLFKAGILLGIMGAAMAGVACNRTNGSSNGKKNALVVEAGVASVRNIQKTAQLFGRVGGANEAKVYCEFPGKIIRYTVREGQRVSKGQTIALVDRSLPGVSYQPYPVRAPAPGIVAFKYLKEGSTVDTRTPLALISSTGRLEVKLDVPARFLVKIKPGAKAWVVVDSTRIPGVITSVSRAVDPRTGAGTARLRVKNTRGLLVSGQVVRAEVVVESADSVLSVPVKSVMRKDGENVVFVIKKGIAHKVPVKIGVAGDDFAEVSGELSQGDTVATTGVLGLADGVPVEVSAR